MSTRRRIGPLLTATAFFALLSPARSQTAPLLPSVPPPDPSTASTVTLPHDTRIRQKLEASRDYIKATDWNEAVRALQDLIELKEDQFLVRDLAPAGGKPASGSGGVRGEALRLLAGLPPGGRDTYQSTYGPKARALLKEALERDDLHLLSQVVQRYLHTEAGAEAAERLGAYHLDRGHRELAGRFFALLLSRPDADRLPPLTLYKVAAACRLAGDAEHEEQAWKALANRAPDGLTIDGRPCDLDQLRGRLARLPTDSPGRGDWPVFRGRADRTARGDGDLPLLEPLWSLPTVLSKQGPVWIDAGVKAQERAGRLALPGFYPIAVPGRIVYRSHSGVHALDPTGRELWAAPSPLALDAIAAKSGKAVVVRNWMEAIYGDAFHFPIENSALGCLSTDGERVYALEDLAVPPPAELIQQFLGGVPVTGPFDRGTLLANRLRAIDLDTGNIRWEIGGRGDLQNSLFVGAPLPAAGRLFALVEKEGESRLVGLDPASGAVLWSQRLGVTPSRLALDPGRRLRGVQMTFAGGLLLCPTDAGALFAFDPLTRGLAWVHVYPSKKPAPDQGASSNLALFNVAWRESAPVVAEGKVVFTPGDGDEVHCVSLRDGKPVWQAAKGDGIYLAGVFRGRVLLVGAGGARALSLKDGRGAWARPAGVPSGQGAASGNVYYLPLKAAKETGGPGVAALDVESGKVLAFAQSRGGEVPGNLTFAGGQVVSQTATALTAYPQLRVRLKRVEELLAADPRNPRGLIERGTLRLDRGDFSGALADLRAAADVAPAGDVKRDAHARLHDALRQALQDDFAAGEKYLAEFEASCRVAVPDGVSLEQRARLETERQRREANYLLVLATGREGQGRVAEALAAYARLFPRADRRIGEWRGPDVGWLAPTGRTPTAAPSAAGGRPSQWVHGQVIGLVVGAAGADKEAVAKEVARQWREIPADADLDEMGRFVALFGTVSPAGMEARLAYAGRLGRVRFLEAELHLLALTRQREAPQVAARALEALARLLTEKGLPDEALCYYRQLAEEFGTTQVRDGKAGADFFKGLALDPRFLPLLDDPWEGRKFKTSEVRGLFLPPGSLMGMEPEGEVPPCLRRMRLGFDTIGGKLKLFDSNSGAELWSQTVSVGNLRPALRAARADAWISYRAEGHLAVVNLGYMAYGIDLLERRLLWARDLGEKSAPVVQTALMQDGQGRVHIAYADGMHQPLGSIAPIQSAAVCVGAHGKLAALDPLSGELRWTLPLHDADAEMIVDDTHVGLLEGQSQGTPALGRVVRAIDGKVRPLNPVRLPLGEPMQAVGRNLLLTPAAADRGPRRLSLYDCLAAKDLWSVPIAAGQFVARSEVPHLTATVARDGKVHVYDLRRREELFKGEVDAEDLRGVTDVRLFQDHWHYYLMINRDVRARDGLAGPAMKNGVSGLRCLPAHGRLYAFRRNGSLHWASEVKGQHLILERLDESPLLLFSAVVQKTDPRSPAPVFTVASIDKATGKAQWPLKEYTPITSPVHMVQINPATGTIDLVTRHWKMRHTVAE
jgi:outer membrane protein assembly factor BamB